MTCPLPNASWPPATRSRSEIRSSSSWFRRPNAAKSASTSVEFDKADARGRVHHHPAETGRALLAATWKMQAHRPDRGRFERAAPHQQSGQLGAGAGGAGKTGAGIASSKSRRPTARPSCCASMALEEWTLGLRMGSAQPGPNPGRASQPHHRLPGAFGRRRGAV